MNHGPGLSVTKRIVTLSLIAWEPMETVSLLTGFTKLNFWLPGTLITSNVCYRSQSAHGGSSRDCGEADSHREDEEHAVE